MLSADPIQIPNFVSNGIIVRMTDPEILERRYPVILNKFSLAEGKNEFG